MGGSVVKLWNIKSDNLGFNPSSTNHQLGDVFLNFLKLTMLLYKMGIRNSFYLHK